MIIGVVKAQLYIHGGSTLRGPLQKDGKVRTRSISSLKQKRSIVKSVIGRLKSRFNISIAEVDHQDSKSTAVIAIAMVSNDTRFIDRQFDAIISFMAKDGRFYLGEIERETFSS